MHVTCVEPVERTRGDGEAMHAYVRRERLERLRAKGRVPSRGRGRGWVRRTGANGSSTSPGNYLEPQYEPRMEMEQ
jgi:hypothetical protein